jgi:universal stress protein A
VGSVKGVLPPSWGYLRGMQLAQHILAPLDFSDASPMVLDAAAMLARQTGARVTVCHVFDAQALGPRGTKVEPEMEQMMKEGDVERTIHEALRNHAEGALEGVEMDTVVITHSNAATGICEYAAEQDVDLIVLSTHGRTGLSHMLIGSVAEQVVRHAPCPVLSLRTKTKG